MDYSSAPLYVLEQERDSAKLRITREQKELERIEEAIKKKQRVTSEAPA